MKVDFRGFKLPLMTLKMNRGRIGSAEEKMPYEVLERKIRSIPEEYFPEIDSFLDFLSYKATAEQAGKVAQENTPSGHPIFGLAKGFGRYPDDINAYDDEVAELFGV